MSRHARRVDSNQNSLVKFIEKCGASFEDLHNLPGVLDGIIGYMRIDQRVEIKDPRKSKSARKLTPAELEVFETWRGRPPIILETEGDVLNLLNQMKWEAENCRPKKII